MKTSSQVSITLGVLQVFAVVLGVFMTRAATSEDLWLLPASGVVWLVREYGYFLLAVPLVWTCLALWMENRADSRWSPVWTVASGFVVLMTLTVFLYETCTRAYWRNWVY